MYRVCHCSFSIFLFHTYQPVIAKSSSTLLPPFINQGRRQGNDYTGHFEPYLKEYNRFFKNFFSKIWLDHRLRLIFTFHLHLESSRTDFFSEIWHINLNTLILVEIQIILKILVRHIGSAILNFANFGFSKFKNL